MSNSLPHKIAQDKLRRFKAYGESVLQGLSSVERSQALPDWVDASLIDRIRQAQQAANKIIERASSPVKIGVMGEFSSGKSLLLGSLLGYADALPISETPTTGNVTAIHLVQQPELQTTKVDQFRVTYLTHADVRDCLAFMLAAAAERGKAAGLAAEQLATLSHLNLNTAEIWSGVLRWSEQAWSSPNLELRYLLRELVGFVRAYNACGAAICGRSYPLTAATAKEGLQLPDSQMRVQELRFEQLPPAPSPWQTAPDQLSVRDLQTTFPLIKRIDLTVEVSREIWDLTALKETNEFILLDFPGLGAAESGVRDTFLSLNELAEVQTILILLNARMPGGDRANRIFTLMQQQRPGQDLKDRILVGVGRFDQLPLSDGAERILTELITPPVAAAAGSKSAGPLTKPLTERSTEPLTEPLSEPLTEAIVLDKLKILRTILDHAQAFTTERDRIVLLSPLLGLASLAASYSSRLQVGSPEFLDNLNYPPALEPSRRLQSQWGQIGDRLQESQSRSPLGRQLAYFAQDGGVGRLRELIQTHVATHGFEQLYSDTEAAAQLLRQELAQLTALLNQIQHEGIPASENQDFVSLKQAIDGLVTAYGRFEEKLGKQPLQDRRGLAVSDIVKDELIFRVHNWREWTTIFNKVKDGTITLEKPGGALGKLQQRVSKTSNAAFPVQSEDFYPAFDKTFREMEAFTHDRIQQAVTDLLNDLLRQVFQERQVIQSKLSAELEDSIQTHFGEQSVELFNYLLILADPQQWLEAIVEITSLNQAATSSPDLKLFFPLAQADEHHRMGQVFDWGPKKIKTQARPMNHQVLVLRLRDEIVSSAGLHLVQQVSELTKQVNQELMTILDAVVPKLQELAKQEALLRYIASGEVERQEVSLPWLRILWQTASIAYPE
jgi:hypothetical protein